MRKSAIGPLLLVLALLGVLPPAACGADDDPHLLAARRVARAVERGRSGELAAVVRDATEGKLDAWIVVAFLLADGEAQAARALTKLGKSAEFDGLARYVASAEARSSTVALRDRVVEVRAAALARDWDAVLARTSPAGEPGSVFDIVLLSLRAQALSAQGKHLAARSAYRRTAAAAGALDWSSRKLRSHLDAVNQSVKAQTYGEILADLEPTPALFDLFPDHPARAGTLFNLAISLDKVQRTDEALALYPQATSAAEKTGDKGLVNAIRRRHVAVLQLNGHPDEARSTLKEWLAQARASGDRGGEGMASLGLGRVDLIGGGTDRGLTHLREGVAILEGLGDMVHATKALNDLALSHEWNGQFSEARAVYTRCIEQAPKVQFLSLVPAAWRGIGLLHSRRGENARALAAYEKGLAVAKTIGDRESIIELLELVANKLRAIDRHEDAVDSLRQAIRWARIPEEAGQRVLLLSALASNLATLDQDREAIAAAKQAVELAQDVGDAHGESVARMRQADVLDAAGRSQEAIEAYQVAVEHCRHRKDLNGVALGLANLGSALARLRRHPEALAARREAHSLLDEVESLGNRVRIQLGLMHS